MSKAFLSLIVLLLAFNLSSEMVHIRIHQADRNIVNWLIDLEITDYKFTDSSAEIYLYENQLSFLEQNNYEYYIISRESEWLRSISDYRTYAEMYSELTEIATNFPGITNMFSLGKSQGQLYYEVSYGSYENFLHEVWCMKISDNPDIDEDEPNVYFAGAIHAREVISLEVDMKVLYHIVQNYGEDPDITYWVDNTQIWFIPSMNPDGHKMVREYGSTSHRKNLRDNDGDEVADGSNQDGVDLNRNFGYVWGNNNASNTASSSIYHGPYAWSEPEVVYVRDLLRSHKFWGGITYHSSGQYVLYPLGHLPGVCSYDHEIMDDLAVNMANTIPRYSSNSSHNQIGYYSPNQAVDFGYTCQGTMGDWGYSELRMFSYTIELCWEHITTESWINQISEDNVEAALMFLDRVHFATVTGNITDETRSPVVAEIYVHEIDFESGMTSVEPVRSDSTYGRYYRSLLPGTYTFTFTYEGYDDIIVENVVVNDSAQTELNVNFTTLPAPYVANPLSSISFNEDSSDSTIDLTTVFAIDDDQELVYTYSNNTNISVEITDGLVDLIPAENWNGEETIIFHATSEGDLSASEDIQVIITPLNDLPYLANPIADFSFMEDTSDNSIDLNNVFADVDLETRDSLVFGYTGNDSISVIINSGLVTLIPEDDWFGSEEIIFTATDDSLATASDTVLVTVNNTNEAPEINLPSNIVFAEDDSITMNFSSYLSDADNDLVDLTLSWLNNDTISVNQSGWDITLGNLIPDWFGSTTLTFTINDSTDRLINSDDVEIIVTPLNDIPYVADPITDFSFMEDTSDNSIDLNNVFADVDLETRESLVFVYSGNDSISVAINSGIVTLTPADNWFGSEEIVFTATDDSLGSASDTVDVTVDAVNDTPYIDLPDSVLIVMNAIFEEDFDQYIYDIEEDPLTLGSSESVNLTIDIDDLTVTIEPDSNWVGEEIVYFSVEDGSRSTNSDSLRILVYADHLSKPVVYSVNLIEGSIRIEWDPVPGSTEYVIYSSENPHSGFVIDESGILEGNVWISPFMGTKRFYRVVAKSDH